MRIVVLGDGLLGSEIVKQTGWEYISRKKDGFDLTDYDSYNQHFIEAYEGVIFCPKYSVIVNCIANTNTYSDDKEGMRNINYKATSFLSDYCKKHKIKLVHISTDYVYAGSKDNASEEDIPVPSNNWYTYYKLLADEYIKLNHSNYLICRELHKPNPFPYDKVWKVQTSGDTVDKIAELIIKLINKDAQGVFNVGTGDKWLKELAPNAEEIEAPSHVPKDTRMNLDKLNKFLND